MDLFVRPRFFPEMNKTPFTYESSGVDTEQEELGMEKVKAWVDRTFSYCSTARVCLPIGYFANVLDIGGGIGIAISTDGVGTKLLVAEQLRRFDTVGIDCVAMNVNDVLCVGARPIAMVDYIAVQRLSPEFLEEIGVGFQEGARLAGVSIPAGEIAQVPEMIRGVGNDSGFDLVGTCIGIVAVDKINTGAHVEPGDVVVGLPSSGVHSNGFTLARKSLLEKGRMTLNGQVRELGRTLGEELLSPTLIYVKEVLSVMDHGVEVKALAHITSDGFMNLARVDAPVGFVLDALPEPPPIFRLIQEKGDVPLEEMYSVYNMGIGFCLVVRPADVEKTLSLLWEAQVKATVIGKAVHDQRKAVKLTQQGLVGVENKFTRM